MTSSNMSAYNTAQSSDIDLREIFLLLAASKFTIFSITSLMAILGVMYSLLIPDLYTSESTFMSSDSQQESVSSMASQLGNVAGLAGLAGGAKQSAKTIRSLAIMRSRGFSANLIDTYDLWVPILAIDGWDKTTNTFSYDENIFNKEKEILVGGKGIRYSPSSYPKAHQAYQSMVSVSEDIKTGIFTLKVKHYSPYEAQKISIAILESINKHIKARVIVEAESSIAFLEKELSPSVNQELRLRIFDLMQSQIERIMLAKVTNEIAFMILDSPTFPETKSQPKRAMICVLFTLIGFVTSILYVIFNKLILNRNTFLNSNY